MRKSLVIGALLALAIASGRAQEPAKVVSYEPQSMAPARTATVVETRITTGRPYSAEATTEFVQTLGDGNKITRKATVRIYRDGEGRTRREELATDGTVKSISIYDPVAHTTYVLDPATRTARKSAIRVMLPTMQPLTDEDKRKVETKIRAELEASGRAGGRVALVAPGEVPVQVAPEEIRRRQQVETVAVGRGVLQPVVKGTDVKNEESLGQKLIDGVLADGKRVTTVLPAGSIGNQQPITVLSEQWFAAGPRNPRDDQAQRSAHGRNHLLAVEHHPRRARRRPLRRAPGLHDPGLELRAHSCREITRHFCSDGRPSSRPSHFHPVNPVASGFSRKAVAAVESSDRLTRSSA